MTRGRLFHPQTAEEDATAGKTRITPYWRVLKSDGSLNPKSPVA